MLLDFGYNRHNAWINHFYHFNNYRDNRRMLVNIYECT